MTSPIQRIKKLLPSMPEKDIKIGEDYLEKNDIEGLKMLVDSALYLTKKNKKKEVVPEKYQNIDIEKLTELKSEVDNYHSLLSNILGDEEFESEIDTELFNQEMEEI